MNSSALWKVMSEFRLYQRSKPNKAHNLIVALGELVNELKSFHSMYDLQHFIRIHYHHFFALKSGLIKTGNITLDDIRTQLFVETLKDVSSFKLAPVSIMFEEFCKGITYFANEIENVSEVVYHRKSSCGPSTTVQDLHYLPQMGNTNGVIERIEKCLIERLIYDELFKQLTLHFPLTGTEEPFQNVNHMNMLEDMKHRYSQCPNKSTIDVHITMNEFSVPIQANIIKVYANNTIDNEVYTKQYTPLPHMMRQYAMDVYCTKVSNVGGIMQYYQKKQGFIEEKQWTLVIDPNYDDASNARLLPRSLTLGGDGGKIKILGRLRKVHKIGRKNMINYKGNMMSIKDARILERIS